MIPRVARDQYGSGALPPGALVDLQAVVVVFPRNGAGVPGFCRDITGRRRAEEKLNDTVEELARLSAHVNELHRLTTTDYRRVEDLFSDYLRTGSEILAVPAGIIAEVGG